MTKKRKNFYFRDWLSLYGRRKLSEKVGVVRLTVDKWARGEACPEAPAMRKIKRISKGVVDYHHIIDREPIKNKWPKPRS